MTFLIDPSKFVVAGSGVTLVGYTADANPAAPSTSMAFPPGTAVGDVAIYAYVTTNSTIPSGWSGGSASMQSSGYSLSYASKVIGAPDLADGYVAGLYGTGKFLLAVYRGVTAATAKTYGVCPFDEDTGIGIGVNQYSLSFTKGGSAKKEVGIWLNAIASYSLSSHPWTNQYMTTAWGFHDADPADYTSGSTITTVWGAPGDIYSAWMIWELS